MALMKEDLDAGARATELSKKMRKLADGGKHPCAIELFARAEDLDRASFASPFDVKAVVGAWARARKVWCRETGEDLI